SQVITVQDTRAPEFTAPGDLTIYSDENCEFDASVEVTGDVEDESDNCSEELEATYSDLVTDGECEGEKIITRTWSLVDECNNAADDQVQVITVKDNIKPTFTAPGDITIYSDSKCEYDASVEVTGDVEDEADNCSTDIEATYSDSVADGECEGEKIITRTWSLVDDCNNSADDQVQIITVEDNIAPTFKAPEDTVIYTDEACAYDASVEFTGDVTDENDNCTDKPEATYSDSVADGECEGEKIITRTWSLVDDCGNEAADQIQIITVEDNIAPTFTAPADLTIYSDDECKYDASVEFTGE
ncbi:gliding motility-associated C-terminal domain-containing protein, partial [Ichthyenterobacterium sp. W332]|nr:gliding motility-associated C-terminal domain-containing protein [Ichthyenterobacterium sp. W332]